MVAPTDTSEVQWEGLEETRLCFAEERKQEMRSVFALAAGAVYRTVPISNSSLFFLHCIKNETSFMDVSFLWWSDLS